jgi:hypothetical protein
MLFKDFHETSNIELGIQCKIVDICNKYGNLLFEENKPSIKRVNRFHSFVVGVVKVGISIVIVGLLLRLGFVVLGGVLALLRCRRVGNELFNSLFCVTNVT